MDKLPEFWTRFLPREGDIPTRIGFSDSSDPRVLEAVRILKKNNWVEPVLIKPSDENDSELILQQAIELLKDCQIDGLVAGATLPTALIVKAALHEIGPKPGNHLISGHFLIETSDRQTVDQTPFIFADCAVVPEPSIRSLAAIAKNASESFEFFTGKPAKAAFLSFSTRSSAQHALVDRLHEALELTKKNNPSLLIDGELQVDAAIDGEIAIRKHAGDSPVAGKANVFIFPTLEAGNIGYKLVQRFGKAHVAGPILWGLARPLSDLSRGCEVEEIVLTTLSVAYWARGKSR